MRAARAVLPLALLTLGCLFGPRAELATAWVPAHGAAPLEQVASRVSPRLENVIAEPLVVNSNQARAALLGATGTELVIERQPNGFRIGIASRGRPLADAHEANAISVTAQDEALVAVNAVLGAPATASVAPSTSGGDAPSSAEPARGHPRHRRRRH